MWKTLVLVAVACFFSPSPVSSATEVDALLAFKGGLSDPDNSLQSWDANTDIQYWFHVTCNGDNRVTRLDLGSLNLAGPLAPELGNLAKLQYLLVYENRITGKIPEELGNLSNLLYLDLHTNQLSGGIPNSLGKLKSLQVLNVSKNPKLSGQIPKAVVSLPNLRSLEYSGTNLSVPP
eukprot:PITA_22037